MAEGRSVKAVTLEQLSALNREIATLIRAGVPLESALTAMGGELPRDLRRVTDALAQRLSAGESLETALDAVGANLPRVYKGVMKAALRSDRPAAALEALATALARLDTMRRSILSAMVYPILVAFAAWLGFVLYAAFIGPRTWAALDDFGLGGRTIGTIRSVSEAAATWGVVVPLALFAVTLFWWYQTSRAALGASAVSRILFAWVPFMPRLLRDTRAAVFLDVLTVLIESRVPFGEALRLAADVTGDKKTLRAASILADRLESGRPPAVADFRNAGFPPLFGWLLLGGATRGDLLPSLRHARETYHRRARFDAEAVRGFAPIVCTGIIGGIVAAAFILAVYVPYVSLMLSLT